MRRSDRPIPLTYRQMVNRIDAVDGALATILLMPRIPQAVRAEITRIRTEMIAPVLRRSGRL